MNKNKFGLVGISFGLFILVAAYYSGALTGDHDLTKPWLVNNFSPILTINAGFLFIVIGILTYLKKINPYPQHDKKIEKAKLNLVATLIAIPFLIAFSALILDKNNTAITLIWLILLIYICFELFRSFNTVFKK